MAKTTMKKKSAVKKPATEKAATKKSTTRKAEAAMEPVEVAEATPDTKTQKKAARAKEPRPRDPRLPEPGTVIQKLGRLGDVRCECLVEADGIRYKDVLYRSLSGAAKAAATDLNLNSKSVNGWLFFGLVKPTRRGADPVEALTKAWQRYEDRMAIFQNTDITADQRTAAAEVIEQHANALMDRSRTFLAGMPA